MKIHATVSKKSVFLCTLMYQCPLKECSSRALPQNSTEMYDWLWGI